MARPKALESLSLSAINKLMREKQQQLAELRKSRRELQSKLDKIDRRIDALSGGKSGGSTRGRNSISLPEAVHQVLAHGKAMPVGDIMEGVLAKGYRSTSPQFRAIVNQVLIKDKRFTKVDRGVYQLKK
ncbi:MAG TPA: hypothetical protein PKB10_01630 [Tepidisphaeraceae bacterium]|nr:hypothetical protein [Tepidisphaeraceae bacterium]